VASIHTLAGSKIGTLTVVSRTKNEKGNRARFVCKCQCGQEHVIFADELLTGKYTACACTKGKKYKTSDVAADTPAETETASAADATEAETK